MRDGKIIVSDLKTNDDIFKKPYHKMLPPFQDWGDQPIGHYKIQFPLYQIMLEDMSGLQVKQRLLIWLHKDNKTRKLYQNHRTPDVTAELREWLSKGIYLK